MWHGAVRGQSLSQRNAARSSLLPEAETVLRAIGPSAMLGRCPAAWATFTAQRRSLYIRMAHVSRTPHLQRAAAPRREPHPRSPFQAGPSPWLLALLVAVSSFVAGCGAVPAGVDRFRGADTIVVSASANLQVVETATNIVRSVRAIPDELTLARGGVAILAATANDAQGRVLSGMTYDWRTLTPLAGSVTSNGVFTAGTIPGTYATAIEVTARQRIDDVEFIATSTVRVTVAGGSFDTGIESVIILPRAPIARVGERVPMRAIAVGDSGGFVQDVSLMWRSLEEAAGVIDETGLLLVGDEPGVYPDVIEVQVRRLGSSAPPTTARVTLTVLTNEAASDQVRAIVGPSFVVGQPGERFPMVLLPFDFEGRPIRSESIRWALADPRAGSISENGVLVLGDSLKRFPGAVVGTADLAGAYAGQSITAAADVVVAPPPGLEVRGTPGSAQVVPRVIRLRQGESARASALYFDGNGQAVTPDEVTWTSDAPIASVDHAGRVTAVGEPGVYQAAIRSQVPREDGSVSTGEAALVILGPLVRVDVIPNVATTALGVPITFTAVGLDAADSRLFDVRLEWDLAEGTPGIITSRGLYVNDDRPGIYPGGVVVRASQIQPR